MLAQGLDKFILIGENILNFHGGDDDYYQEWFEELDNGWIAMVNFRPYVTSEMTKFHLDYYLNYGGELDDISGWRTLTPMVFCQHVQTLLSRRLGPGA
jgi:hypothetical protein